MPLPEWVQFLHEWLQGKIVKLNHFLYLGSKVSFIFLFNCRPNWTTLSWDVACLSLAAFARWENRWLGRRNRCLISLPLICPPKEKQEAEAEPEMDSPTPSKCSSIYKCLLCKVFGFYMIKIENAELWPNNSVFDMCSEGKAGSSWAWDEQFVQVQCSWKTPPLQGRQFI